MLNYLARGDRRPATASKAGITDKTSTAYSTHLRIIFLNGTQVLQEAASNTAPQDSDFNFKDVGFDLELAHQAKHLLTVLKYRN